MPETKVIPPTIGRRVLVFTADGLGALAMSVPFDAGISFVHDDGSINVGLRDHQGRPMSMNAIPLHDRAQAEHDAHRTELGNYAVWMPYQFEQALRAQYKAQLAQEPQTGTGGQLPVSLQSTAPTGSTGSGGDGAGTGDQPLTGDNTSAADTAGTGDAAGGNGADAATAA